jgi:hypothetical protein
MWTNASLAASGIYNSCTRFIQWSLVQTLTQWQIERRTHHGTPKRKEEERWTTRSISLRVSSKDRICCAAARYGGARTARSPPANRSCTQNKRSRHLSNWPFVPTYQSGPQSRAPATYSPRPSYTTDQNRSSKPQPRRRHASSPQSSRSIRPIPSKSSARQILFWGDPHGASPGPAEETARRPAGAAGGRREGGGRFRLQERPC